MATKNIKYKVSVDGNDAEKGFSKIETKAESLDRKFKSVGNTLLTVFAGKKLFDFLGESLKAYGEQEKAVALLEATLGKSAKGLSDFASQMQKVTTFGDENIMMAEKMVADFTKNEEVIKQVTKATIDFAAAKSLDLVSASEIVSKSIFGETNMLGRYGVSIKEGLKGNEKMIAILEKLNSMFGGQASAVADTYSGKLIQMKNRFGDIQETIGEKLLPVMYTWFTALDQAMTKVEQGSSRIDPFTGVIKGLATAFIAVKAGIVEAGTLIGGFAGLILKVYPTLAKVLGSLTFEKQGGIVVPKIDVTGIEALNNYEASLNEFFRSVKEPAEQFRKEFDALWESIDKKKEIKGNPFSAIISGAETAKSKIITLKDAIEKLFGDTVNNKIEDQAKFLQRYIEVLGKNPLGQNGMIKPALISKQEKFDNFLTQGFTEEELGIRPEDIQRKYLDLFNSTKSIGQDIQNIFGAAGDTFIGKLNEAFSIVESIIRIMEAYSKIDTILSLLGLVTGGATNVIGATIRGVGGNIPVGVGPSGSVVGGTTVINVGGQMVAKIMSDGFVEVYNDKVSKRYIRA